MRRSAGPTADTSVDTGCACLGFVGTFLAISTPAHHADTPLLRRHRRDHQNGTRLYGSRVVGGQGISEPSEYHAVVAQAQAATSTRRSSGLTMAQRTADEHVATARRDAERIRGEARASAEQIITEAQTQAGACGVRRRKFLAEARAAPDRAAREAEALSSQTEQQATGILTDARGRAEGIVKEAEANARDIKHRAQQIYEDVVGGLSTKRESLQQQIESLERFDGSIGLA